MILRELFYADHSASMQSSPNDMRYSSGQDSSVVSRNDTRKTRLTLRQINKLRKASEQHILEQEADIEFVRDMYMAPAAQP